MHGRLVNEESDKDNYLLHKQQLNDSWVFFRKRGEVRKHLEKAATKNAYDSNYKPGHLCAYTVSKAKS